jgi:hypothetical protein
VEGPRDDQCSGDQLGGPGSKRRLHRAVHAAALSPFLWGAHLGHWLLGLTIGIALGIYFYVRRERYTEPGPDADDTRFPR